MSRASSKSATAIPLLCFAILCACSCGCNLEGGIEEGQVVVMTYNVQNLFDPFVSGTEYPEYTPEGGWSAEQYHERLEQVARAITQGHRFVPDIVLLQEIEHERVLEDLLRFHLAKRGFQWYAATAEPDSAIQVGILSTHPILEAFSHRVQGTRAILESRIDLGTEQVVVLNVHAKSRKEGMEETEDMRLATSCAVTARTEELLASKAHMPIIIGGDFNESADAAVREDASFSHALVPVQSSAFDTADDGALLLTGSAPSSGHWYSWWLDRTESLMAGSPGSYLYQGVWESFDQLLLSPAFFDGWGGGVRIWRSSRARAVGRRERTPQRMGCPHRARILGSPAGVRGPLAEVTGLTRSSEIAVRRISAQAQVRCSCCV